MIVHRLASVSEIAATKLRARHVLADSFARSERTLGPQVVTAMVEGVFEAAVDWMVTRLGKRTAYDILQRRADALATDITSRE